MKLVWKRTACIVCVTSLCAVSLTSGSAATITAPEDSVSIPLYGVYEPVEEGETVYSVSITWGEMEYTYSQGAQGTWDPSTHTYRDSVASSWGWEEGSNQVSVTNHSNAGVEVLLAAATNGNVTGDFYDQSKGGQALPEDVLHLDTAVGTSVDEAPTEKVYYQITGGEIQESGAIGSLTVTLQGTGETGEEENEEETSGQVVTNLPLRNATGEQPTPLYTTGTANVYRTDVLEGLLVMNGGDAITIEGTDYYLGGEIVNTYSSVSLGFSPNSLCYLQMQEGMSFRLEIDLNNLTIATVTG